MTKGFQLNKNVFRQMERDINREVAKVNRNIKPIEIPAQSSDSIGGITIHNTDNRVTVGDNATNLQIGGSGNYQINNQSTDIEGILREIRELSKVMNDNDRVELSVILNELQSNGQIGESHKPFLEKHALIAMGISAVISWALTHGLDKLIPIIQQVFSN